MTTKMDTQQSISEDAERSLEQANRCLAAVVAEIKERLQEAGDAQTLHDLESSQKAWQEHVARSMKLCVWYAKDGTMSSVLSCAVCERAALARVEELQSIFGDLLQAAP